MGSPNSYDHPGAAYVFERSGSSWNQVAKLTASDADSGDEFGCSVSISSGYAIVGAKGAKWYGSAYIFERSGNSWNQVAKLTASDPDSGERFGHSVSLSHGNAIVGAPNDWQHPGSAYIFERSGSSWKQVVKLNPSHADTTQFGRSVSISGDYAIVGSGKFVGEGDRKYTYIFERSGNSWNQVSNPAVDNDFIKDQVSISGGYAILAGSRYGPLIFGRNSSGWKQVYELTAGDVYFSDSFYSVSISGRYAIVADDGAAYIFDLFIPNYVDEDVDKDVDKVTVLPMPWIPLLLLDD